MNFDIVINTDLMILVTPDGSSVSTSKHKRLLALVNDYENESWRYSRFDEFIWDNIAQTSLSARERDSLLTKSKTTLKRSAMSLRLTDNEEDPGRGSEIAEIVMYAVMKHHFKALPIVPKIFYKQNKNDYAKGADSVHIVLEQEEGNFTLWLGESKFYSDIANARLDKIVASITELLSTEKIRRENSIIIGLGDLDELVENSSLRAKIRYALDDDRSIDRLKPLLNVPILLLHECEITKTATSLDDKYLEQIHDQVHDRATEYFKRQDAKLKGLIGYEKIQFHFIVFPVPNKAKIVNDFISFAKILKGG